MKSVLWKIRRSGIQITIEKKKLRQKTEYLFWRKIGRLEFLFCKVSWQKISFQLLINNLCISYSHSSRNIVKPDTKYLFRNYLIDSFAAFTEFPSELDPIMIHDAMTVTCCSITTKMVRFYSKSLLYFTSWMNLQRWLWCFTITWVNFNAS